MTLSDIIRSKIPPSTLERVVFDQGVIGATRRTALFKASGLTADEIAQQTVADYGDQAPWLAFGLYEQVNDTDWDTARLLFDHFKGKDTYYYNQQASLVGRIPTLPMEALGDFVRTVKGQVCLVLARKGKNSRAVSGTGFLVGPDLVLTCRHVLRSFPSDEELATNGGRIELYFDFHRGEPVESIDPDLPKARRVELAAEWHVASCQDTMPDGLDDNDLQPADAARIAKSLDFVLLRLSEKVGLQPLEPGGGRRRGWITFPDDKVPRSLAEKDWIIIPQHPNGLPQRIDLGRFRASDKTETRIRYNTNTAHGTSGAPCFNQQFALVGMHNAYVGPEANPLANQAIRLDWISACVRQFTEVAALTAVPRWSISRLGEEPKVILGRDALLAWLRASASARPRTLADRVYAAHATAPGAGCSFSIDVLHAEIRETRVPRAVYGSRGQQLPATPEDFLRSLLRELGIDAKQVEADDPMPPRPGGAAGGANAGGALPPLAGEVDNLVRWISDELPNWLARVINALLERKVDARIAARQDVDLLTQRHLPVPPELAATADATEPVLVQLISWDVAYVVIDELRASGYTGTGPRTVLQGEVLALIAALVKGQPELTMDAGLKRLRWMFLGALPDFIPAADAEGNGATLEALDPAAVGERDVQDVFDRLTQTNLRMEDMTGTFATTAVWFLVQQVAGTAAQKRLEELQKSTSKFAAGLLLKGGKS